MFPAGPLNDHYIELMTDSAGLSKTTVAGQYRGYTMEFMLDVMITEYDSVSQLGDVFAGPNDGLGWFEFDTPGATANREAPFRFASKRGSTTKKSGDGTVVLGQRTVLFGRDSGVNVFGWQDGVALGKATSQADWTATQAADAILVVSSFPIGSNSALTSRTRMRLYEAMLRINGRTILHVRPKPYMADLTTPLLKDLSEFANDLTISGTEDTDWWIKKAWTEEPAFAGGENLG